jgi:hypothetical protein
MRHERTSAGCFALPFLYYLVDGAQRALYIAFGFGFAFFASCSACNRAISLSSTSVGIAASASLRELNCTGVSPRSTNIPRFLPSNSNARFARVALNVLLAGRLALLVDDLLRLRASFDHRSQIGDDPILVDLDFLQYLYGRSLDG